LGHLEGYWEFVRLRQLYERFAANLRVLLFDHRGNGLSDGFTDPPSITDRTLDIKAVMDDAGLERVGLFGFDFGSQLAVAFATTFPERVDRLVLCNSRVGASAAARAKELNPAGEYQLATPEDHSTFVDTVGVTVAEDWMKTSPSIAGDPDGMALLPRFMRMVGTRDVYQRQLESVARVDVTDLAPLITAPTLITHSVDDPSIHHVGFSRVLAELIPNSTLVEFDGEDHMFWMSENWREMADASIRFLADAEIQAPLERVFAVVLFTDIVGSTHSSAAVGDAKWRSQLDSHDQISRRVISSGGGNVIKTTGDGVLAIFDSPTAAITTAAKLREELSNSGIAIRAGLHAGEIEVRGDDVSGAVVNLAARVEQVSGDGEIYTTRSLRDLLLGSTHRFEPAGHHNLKGFDGEWELHRLVTG
ncbi:MAG: adenylate/guanylate cyclase domain-containing protein, partial [Acidimicrobiia bacterium]|nr:adenylate/guanylate cyclase domain-containing protein [Acidimicrobiia bacterium]